MIKAWLCEGSGNRFVLFDERRNPGLCAQRNWITELCSTLNTDGTLHLLSSDRADYCMRMFNTDASEAEMCGNGLRCLARYILDQSGCDSLRIDTMKAILQVKKVADLAPAVTTISCQIGPLSHRPDSLPMQADSPWLNRVLPELHPQIAFTAISVPNPHLIGVLDQLPDAELTQQLGETVQNMARFPRGINLSLIQHLDGQHIFVRTFERGVGLTSSCGTAMSASAWVAVQRGLCQTGTVSVINQGGFVRCIVARAGIPTADDRVLLQGNASFEAELTLQQEPSGQLQLIDRQPCPGYQEECTQLQHARTTLLRTTETST